MCDDLEDRLKSLQDEIDSLRNKLRIAESFQVHNLHFAAQSLAKCAAERLKGSCVILEVSNATGKTIIGPVALSGFSPETISGLLLDIRRTFADRTEFRP